MSECAELIAMRIRGYHSMAKPPWVKPDSTPRA
jgi:hypothetical protein